MCLIPRRKIVAPYRSRSCIANSFQESFWKKW